MRWASAATAGSDLDVALGRVLEEVGRGLDGAEADAAFLFVGAAHASGAEAVRARVRAAMPHARLVGCTAGGVLGGGREYETPSGLAVTAAHLPGVDVRTFHVEAQALPDPDAPPAAWQALTGVPPSASPGFVLLADPFSFPAETLLAGLDFAYPEAPKVGGLASGADRRGDQILFLDDLVLREGAVGLALAGDAVVAPAVAQGCRPFGPVMRITACEANLLRELDGAPALAVVQRAVREAAARDPALARPTVLAIGFETDPFSVEQGAWLIRNILGREAGGEGLYVGETLRPGRRVRLAVRDRIASAEDLERTLAATGDGPGAGCRGALLFSCLGRGMHLYGVPDHDTRAFHARFRSVPLGGFFCSGEIGPVGGTTRLHGFTSSFALVRPRNG